jgi:hypothetical protein
VVGQGSLDKILLQIRVNDGTKNCVFNTSLAYEPCP